MSARTKKHSFKPKFFIILLIAVVALGVVIFVVFSGPKTYDPPKKGHILYELKHSPASQVEKINVDLKSRYAAVYDLTSRRLLFTKNANKKARPASLTKVMTAIVALENIDNLETEIPVPRKVVNDLEKTDLARLGLVPGEELTGRELLYGLLLPSAADCANTLAVAAGGSIKGFVRKMNEKAKELKMNNTSFGNPVGDDDDKTYTTAKDYLKLLRYALKNRTFKKIFCTKKYTLASSNKRNYPIDMHNLTFTKFTGDASFIKGGKTGTTDGAQLCLATLGELNANQYLTVTMYAKPSAKHPLPTGEDATAVYNEIEDETNEIIDREYK